MLQFLNCASITLYPALLPIMSLVPWSALVNFPSALLLHSCITIILKESFNGLEIVRRITARGWSQYTAKQRLPESSSLLRTSAVLDAYTSVLSHDFEGELAELYFTNTGVILLAVSLASSVAMNLLLSSALLNTVVASTFGLTFIASLFVCKSKYTLPLMALRRAARFIWSDTPFVNFFTLIYIATVLKGQTSLRLKDYVTFRSIAVLELLFMKAKLAASHPEKQISLMRQVINSERVLVSAVSPSKYGLPEGSMLRVF